MKVEVRKRLSFLILLLCSRIIARRRKTRRFWIRPSLHFKRASILREHAKEDDHGLCAESLRSRGYFKSLTRMPAELFDKLFTMIKNDITKSNTNFRKSVCAIDR